MTSCPAHCLMKKHHIIGNETKPAHAEAILTKQCYKTIIELSDSSPESKHILIVTDLKENAIISIGITVVYSNDHY